VTTRPAYLFRPSTAIRWVRGGGRSLTAGQNPPGGAVIDFFLGRVPTSAVTLEIRDAAGATIRTFSSDTSADTTVAKTAADSLARATREKMKDSVVYEPADSVVSARRGTNRFVWNLRYPPAKRLKNTLNDEGTFDGPLATPGNYSVRLIVGRDTLTRQFALIADPRLKTTTAELAQQFALATRVRDRITDVVEGALRVEDIQSQLDQRVAQSKDLAFAKRVADAVQPLRDKLEVIRGELYEIHCHVDQCSLDQPMKLYNQLLTINAQVQTGDYGPTQQHGEMFTDFSGKVAEQLRKLQQLEDAELAAVNKLMTEVQLPVVFVPPRKAVPVTM
jgi:hypothetical protein